MVRDRKEDLLMIEYFQLNNLTKNVYVVGTLTQEVMDLLNLNRTETSLLLGKDKILYTEKHKHQFVSEESYKKHIEAIPEIIINFDYVAFHPSKNSIEYIKKMDEIMVVAARFRQEKELWIKTAFPISEGKLNIYNKLGTLKSKLKTFD